LLIWVKLEREYFCEWGWTGQITFDPLRQFTLKKHGEE
jgi:hypothetical protein